MSGRASARAYTPFPWGELVPFAGGTPDRGIPPRRVVGIAVGTGLHIAGAASAASAAGAVAPTGWVPPPASLLLPFRARLRRLPSLVVGSPPSSVRFAMRRHRGFAARVRRSLGRRTMHHAARLSHPRRVAWRLERLRRFRALSDLGALLHRVVLAAAARPAG